MLQPHYIFTMTFICIISPLLTVSVIASILISLSAKRRYICSYFKTAYIFSDLNERSITLATDLKKNHPKSAIIFTDVVDRDEESFLDLSNKARSIGAILFKDDILSQKFNFHKKSSYIYFFIIGDNEAENIAHSLEIIEKYKEREKTSLYLFSSSRESELALSKLSREKMEIHRVNEAKSLIYRTLYENGKSLFNNAIEDRHDGKKHINAIILGLGNYGTEMAKALA